MDNSLLAAYCCKFLTCTVELTHTLIQSNVQYRHAIAHTQREAIVHAQMYVKQTHLLTVFQSTQIKMQVILTILAFHTIYVGIRTFALNTVFLYIYIVINCMITYFLTPVLSTPFRFDQCLSLLKENDCRLCELHVSRETCKRRDSDLQGQHAIKLQQGSPILPGY